MVNSGVFTAGVSITNPIPRSYLRMDLNEVGVLGPGRRPISRDRLSWLPANTDQYDSDRAHLTEESAQQT